MIRPGLTLALWLALGLLALLTCLALWLAIGQSNENDEQNEDIAVLAADTADAAKARSQK